MILQTSKRLLRTVALTLLTALSLTARAETAHDGSGSGRISKVLFIGDSMTGWLSERLGAYGELNGFDVATVVWDGSTIGKWADSPRLRSLISERQPDAVFISLGMNELFESNPQKQLGSKVDKIMAAAGDIPVVWIGPPSWPGYSKGETLNRWMQSRLGGEVFFRSFDLTLPRQSSSNPHPSKNGMEKWMDSVMDWIPAHTGLQFSSLEKPREGKMKRGKVFIYKKMKETL